MKSSQILTIFIMLAGTASAQIQSDFLRTARPACQAGVPGVAALTFDPETDPDHHRMAVLDASGAVLAHVPLGVNRGGQIRPITGSPGEFLVSGVKYPAFTATGTTEGVFIRLKADSATDWVELGRSTLPGVDPFEFSSLGDELLILDYKSRRLVRADWDPAGDVCPATSFSVAFTESAIPALANPHLLVMLLTDVAAVALHDVSDHAGIWVISRGSSGQLVSARRSTTKPVVVPSAMPYPTSCGSIPLVGHGVTGTAAVVVKDASGATVWSGNWPTSTSIPMLQSVFDNPGHALSITTDGGKPIQLVPIVRYGAGLSAPDVTVGPVVFNPYGLFVGSTLNGHGVRCSFASGTAAQDVSATLLVGFRTQGQDPVVTYTYDGAQVTTLDGTAVSVPIPVDLEAHEGWVGTVFPVPDDSTLEGVTVLWQYVFVVGTELALSEVFGAQVHEGPGSGGLRSSGDRGIDGWRDSLVERARGRTMTSAEGLGTLLEGKGWVRN